MSRLRVEGEVISPCELGFEDLAVLPEQVADIGEVIPGRRGGAVRLRSVLRRAGLVANATHLTVEATDGVFAASVPLASVREALVAYRLGDAPLPADQGGPLRFFAHTEECAHGDADPCANVKFVACLRVTIGPGRDTRPTTEAEHAKLHE